MARNIWQIFLNLLFVFCWIGSVAYGATWLEIGPDARGVALGMAQVAESKDAYASYWNPAGLVAKHGVVSTYGKLLGEIDYRYLGYSQPLWGGSFGASYMANEMAGFKHTEYSNDGRPVIVGGDFSSKENAILLSYAQELGPSFKVGGTFKLLSASLYNANASGWGLDLGAQGLLDDGIHVGFVAHNLVSSGLLWSTGVNNALSTQVKLGIKFAPLKDTTVVVDYDLAGYDNPKSYAGVEYHVEGLDLRAGYNKNSITLGLGLAFQEVEFDFAFSKSQDSNLDASSRFSLGYVFPPVRIIAK